LTHYCFTGKIKWYINAFKRLGVLVGPLRVIVGL